MARVDQAADGADGTLSVCESCAGDDDDLQAVWPAAGPSATPASGTGESAELWCAGCRAQFPHEAATDGEGEADEAG